MDDDNKQGDDVLNDSQIDLEKIRESRLQRTREAMMEFDRDIAISVIPENNPNNGLSVIENAAICLQKHFRGYLGRKQYREKLLEQYEKDEEEREKKQKQQTEEAEILVEMARLQLEVEEDNTIHRNRQRMLNVYATRIQRAWRHYVANRSTHTHQGDSFEEQVYQATGLNVTDIIINNAMLSNTTSNQPEAALTDSPSVLHSNDVDSEACVPEASEEDTKASSNPSVEVMQDNNASSPAMDNTNENNLVVEDIRKSSPTNAEEEKEDVTANDTQDSTSSDHVRENDNDVKEEDTAANESIITQRGDKKVRFNLQDSEDKEDSTVTQTNSELIPSAEDKKSSNDFFSSDDEVSFTMPAEQVKQLGYTQLRELKCSLETKLGSLSDQLIMELQSRERLLAHKDFLLEKIQNLSKLVQDQHKINQKQRRRVKSSGH